MDTASIDWRRPWYASVGELGMKIVAQPDVRAALNQLGETMQLTNQRGLPVRFVEQAALPAGVPYESFISATGKVPTRDNLHDFFNALVWLSFPNIKRVLNALQSAQIDRAGIDGRRGATRDAATIFDENAALLVVTDTIHGAKLLDALRNHRWQEAFIERRAAFGVSAAVWTFGHALMEKLVKPYKSITAHAWPVTAPEEFFSMSQDAQRSWLDAQMSAELAARDLHTGGFTPLPVLGVPGWWHPQDRHFYDDAEVFRAKKS